MSKQQQSVKKFRKVFFGSLLLALHWHLAIPSVADRDKTCLEPSLFDSLIVLQSRWFKSVFIWDWKVLSQVWLWSERAVHSAVMTSDRASSWCFCRTWGLLSYQWPFSDGVPGVWLSFSFPTDCKVPESCAHFLCALFSIQTNMLGRPNFLILL